MATIKEIADIVGVSSGAVSRVLNYDDGISVSQETRDAIFAAAEKVGYRKKVIYPKIENVALLYWIDEEDDLEESFYLEIKEELVRQAKKVNIQLSVYDKNCLIKDLPKDLTAFIAMGRLNRKAVNQLYKICKKGVFIGTSPDEKLFDAVKPNHDSYITQIVDYFVEKGYKKIGFVGGWDCNIDTEKPSMDVREWSFRQTTIYYNCLNEDFIYLANAYAVDEGYRIGKIIAGEKERPTALCIACDTLAVGVLQALNEENIQVPDDIAIFSINDMNIARYVSPPLTSFHIDIPIICETALDLLRDKVLTKRKITKTVYVNGLPNYRRSC